MRRHGCYGEWPSCQFTNADHLYDNEIQTPKTIKHCNDNTDLSTEVSRRASHVVMHGRQYGNRLLGDVNSCEDHGGLRDTGQTLLQLFRGQMVELEVNMVLLGAAAATWWADEVL